MKKRKLLRNSLLGFGAGLLSFGWWGLETTAGRHYFDEMAGIIPLGAGIVGTGIVVAVSTWSVYCRLRGRASLPADRHQS